VLPLQFRPGESVEALGLTGQETLTIRGLAGGLVPRQELRVELARKDGGKGSFQAIARLDTAVEIGYYANGGILQAVLRKMLKG
jgi:aconitate hydratase